MKGQLYRTAILDQGKREVKEKEQSTFSRQQRFAQHILSPHLFSLVLFCFGKAKIKICHNHRLLPVVTLERNLRVMVLWHRYTRIVERK